MDCYSDVVCCTVQTVENTACNENKTCLYCLRPSRQMSSMILPVHCVHCRRHETSRQPVNHSYMTTVTSSFSLPVQPSVDSFNNFNKLCSLLLKYACYFMYSRTYGLIINMIDL
ncbi:hypothetical protein NP493_782g01082 [Ridgeia piscesae]|uniref:Uncharacterized protein n=1 Tax=Ridgeia piscesae TaxID=27915 RepID=A0AAD9KNW8_RIDPI|nr:hypothetical protein NP493_782g01082 [Ridgeia piscesae]